MKPPPAGSEPVGAAWGAPGHALPPALIRRLPQRDPEALSAFYEAYFDRVFAFVRRMVGQEQLAEDLTQDVFLQVHQSIPSYDPERALDPWVFTIAANKVRDFWRSRRHKLAAREVQLAEDESDDASAAEGGAPSQPLEGRELAEILEHAVQGLRPSMRSALVLRLEGLAFDDIARMLDRNEEAVRKRYSRALEELRRVLSKVPAFGGDGREDS